MRPAGKRVAVLLPVALLLVAASCQGAAAPTDRADAEARGAAVEPLAGGLVAALPSGSVFVRVQSVAQDPGSEFPSSSHAAGFIYQDAGAQRFTAEGAKPIEIATGEAVFQSSVAHVHANPGPAPNHWYFLAVWPSSVRGAPPVNPLAKEVYLTEDLPPSSVQPGPYGETLRRGSLAPSGRTAAVRHGGTQVLFVLEGSLSVHLAGQSAATIVAGQGVWQRPGAGIQVFNASKGSARYLDLLLTPTGQPFEIDLDRPV